MTLAGIDGCGLGRWVIAFSDDASGSVRFEVREDLTEMIDSAARGDAVVTIDIPIGSSCATRLCDQEARRIVGPRRAASVFTPPCREALRASTHREASRINRRMCGRGLTIQAFGILPRIRQIDRLMSPRLQASVREAHPEVTFAVLNGRPLVHSKKTPAGEAERLALLREAGVRFDVKAERECLGARLVRRDDLLDAAACLVTARRIRCRQEQVLPGAGAQLDARGLRMEIVA